MAKVNVSLPDQLLAQVDELATELSRSRSGLVQEATARYVTQLREERDARERSERIAGAMREMRELSKLLPAGPDTTELIRRDRDSDYGHGSADE